jgi:hypothetical protein
MKLRRQGGAFFAADDQPILKSEYLNIGFKPIRKFQSAGRLPPENSVALINPVNEGA